ncbi:mas-related G-protein coupled receptor member X2-like [Rousettus aegyptiacus]|uniref:mas-related G-protein coupled receptor member X2-like n=1 Tax=Rousettus aegyptiacus TaxID=9407 RepID=UPI00168D4240|nr:mas-related G-protein coupled receptor member X2-like [Rousettus aegyptiacus]
MVLSGTSEGFLSTNSTITPMNGSDQDLLQNFKMEILISQFLTVTFSLLGLAGNAIVLWLLGFRMRRNAFSVYILNLAGADFLFLCCQIIYSLNVLINYYHSVSIDIPNFFITVLTFAYVTGLSFLSIISMERCLSVLWPIWYRCLRPRHMSAFTCTLLWALSLILSVLEGNYCEYLIGDFHNGWCRLFDFITAAWLIFLFVLLSGSSLALLTRLLHDSQHVRLTRLYVTNMVTVLFFLLCGLPFGIQWFLLIWIHNSLDAFFIHLHWLTLILCCVNSCANPIIYFFVGSFRQRWRKRRQTLKLVLQRALQDFPELDEREGSLPQDTLEMSGSSLVS